MKTWQLKNGVIGYLANEDSVFYPNSCDILKSKDSEKFTFEGSSIDSFVKQFDIRISSIGKAPQFRIVKGKDGYHISMFVLRREIATEVGIINGHFVDYVLVDGILYYLIGHYDRVQNILNKIDVSKSLSISDCLRIVKEFEKLNIPLINDIRDEINDRKTITISDSPIGLKARLYPYQQTGSSWISFMIENGCGNILGDEMGLGKTLQIISVLGEYKSRHESSHFLIVCPVSLLENWKREINKFYPSMSVLVHHGYARTGYYECLLDYDIVLISYSNLMTDFSMLNMINWDIMVIDEAQNIKNPKAQRTKYAKDLQKKVAIAVTGTPFENKLSDIWSITDFVLPNYLGSLREFELSFDENFSSASQIEKLISPILIRRKVEDVAKDLPKKVVIPHPIQMTENEAMYYENGLIAIDENALNDKKLSVIQKLRMFCTHPFVYDKSLREDNPINFSYKYSLLCDILEEIIANNEKSVVFTSFNEMSDIIVSDCKKRFNVKTFYINGSVPTEKRQSLIDEFSSQNGASILVLNPRAAGAGLNITAANHVIHYNLEWNPSVEDQASARCFRRGQTKTVFIHRLYYVDTIEEFINDKIHSKRELADIAIKGNEGDSTPLDLINEILKYSPLK